MNGVPEPLNGQNALLLTSSIDHRFDRGFVGFEGNGNVIIPGRETRLVGRLGLDASGPVHVATFTAERQFLESRRETVLVKVAR